MDEMKRLQRRAMRARVVRSVIVVAMCAFASPFAVSAQATTTTTPERASRPLLLAGAKKSGPLQKAATVGMLIPLRPLERSNDFGGGFRAYRGVLVEAAAGDEGFELAAGWARRLKSRGGPVLFGEDVMATAFRTKNETADTTYVGGEVGLTMLMLRVSVGAATRVSGASDETDRTIVTWGVGFHIGR